jgi:hypothetical protein
VHASIPALGWTVQNCSFPRIVFESEGSEPRNFANTSLAPIHLSRVDMELNWTAWQAPVLPHSGYDNEFLVQWTSTGKSFFQVRRNEEDPYLLRHKRHDEKARHKVILLNALKQNEDGTKQSTQVLLPFDVTKR